MGDRVVDQVVTAGAETTQPEGRRGPGQRGQRRILAVALVLLCLGTVTIGGSWLWVQRSTAGLIQDANHAVSAPVGLVLGAGLTQTGQPTPFLAARLDVAAQLYRAGKVTVLLVSGDNRAANYNEPDAMRTYLVGRHGIPAEHVVTDYAGRDTYDSCVRAVRIFDVTRALVISQGYHVPRAVAICRAIGLDALGVGDWTAEQYADVWRSGAQRELLANVKAAADVLTSRDPVLGAPETAVTDALRHAVASGGATGLS